MTTSDQRRLDRQFDRIEKLLPGRAGRILRWLRQPSSLWARIPAGILLILGGIFSFLPVLGIWMLPLGILLLALDLPFLQRPTTKVLIWGERWWCRWRRRRRARRKPA